MPWWEARYGSPAWQGRRRAFLALAFGRRGGLAAFRAMCHAETKDGSVVLGVLGGGSVCEKYISGPPPADPPARPPRGRGPAVNQYSEGREACRRARSGVGGELGHPHRHSSVDRLGVPGARDRVASRRGLFDARGRRHGAWRVVPGGEPVGAPAGLGRTTGSSGGLGVEPASTGRWPVGAAGIDVDLTKSPLFVRTGESAGPVCMGFFLPPPLVHTGSCPRNDFCTAQRLRPGSALRWGRRIYVERATRLRLGSPLLHPFHTWQATCPS